MALACVGFITPRESSPGFPTANTVSYRIDIAEMDPEFRKGQSNPPSFHAPTK